MKFLSAVLILAASAQVLSAQLARALDLNDRGNAASDAGHYQEAIGLYRDALAIWRESGPKYDSHRAGTLFNLGIVISATGNRPEAAQVLEQSLALHRKTLGVRDHRTISNINLLASNYLMIGRVDEAEALLKEALPIDRELFPDEIQTARTLAGLCNVMVRRGHPEDAIAPAEEALRIAIKAAGENSLDVALAYSNVGEAHRSAGRPERALPLFRKARELYEKALGPEHPRVAALLSQEGLILMGDGKLATADRLMTRAVESLGRGCPNCAVELAIVENNLALLRFKQQRYRDADELLSHAIALRERFSPTPGAEMAGTLRLLAAVRKKEHLYEDAARLTARADVILGYH